MRKSRLSWSKQLRLIEHFVSGSTARCASRLVGVNKSTGAYYFHRLREIIALELEAEADDVFGGVIEVDESYFGGRRKGEKTGAICRSLGVSEQSYYRWRREYGGLKVSQARRLKELEKENQRLRKAVSNLNLDALILKEAIEGKYLALLVADWPLIMCVRHLGVPSAVPARPSANTVPPRESGRSSEMVKLP